MCLFDLRWILRSLRALAEFLRLRLCGDVILLAHRDQRKVEMVKSRGIFLDFLRQPGTFRYLQRAIKRFLRISIFARLQQDVSLRLKVCRHRARAVLLFRDGILLVYGLYRLVELAAVRGDHSHTEERQPCLAVAARLIYDFLQFSIRFLWLIHIEKISRNSEVRRNKMRVNRQCLTVLPD